MVPLCTHHVRPHEADEEDGGQADDKDIDPQEPGALLHGQQKAPYPFGLRDQHTHAPTHAHTHACTPARTHTHAHRNPDTTCQSEISSGTFYTITQ